MAASRYIQVAKLFAQADLDNDYMESEMNATIRKVEALVNDYRGHAMGYLILLESPLKDSSLKFVTSPREHLTQVIRSLKGFDVEKCRDLEVLLDMPLSSVARCCRCQTLSYEKQDLIMTLN
ncbi:hypothetical protein HDU76_010424 [Blyttiomyces sp. JEL0837]|nr:hypothetical protein HDU76_010424 [Blyttiomyces sp. JEL0837]